MVMNGIQSPVYQGSIIVKNPGPDDQVFIVGINTAHKAGVVYKVTLTISPTYSHENYYMEWDNFQEIIQPENIWVYISPAHPFSIPGNSSVSKIPMFKWYTLTPEKLTLRQGKYILRVDMWSGNEGGPTITSFHELVISNAEADQIESRKEVIYLTLDAAKSIAKNRILTEHELKSLLGK